MKCLIPEISWHNREPVLSADFQPINAINNGFYRLATGGSDTLVLIWKLKVLPNGQIDVSVLSELTRHQRSVNVVKWSPNGDILASADDDGNIILWQIKTDNIPSLDEKEDEFEEKWNAFKVLRGHKEDVYDLCWSPKSDKLLSGSVDNTAILWDVIKGKNEHIIKDHKGFVQGVAWDPKSDFVATLCSDRICRVYDRNGRRVRARIGRGILPVDENNELFEKDVKYFHDDTFKSYFRRLNFSPDGSLLLVPSGAVETEEKKNALFGTFVFTLDTLKNPACVFSSGKQCSIAVSCCPILFELREKGPKPLINLPYRMIIAVATDSDVILYDTQQLSPCVHLQNIHYTRLTDLTWSSDGLLLAASSTDGFITLVSFEEGELGTTYVKEESDLEDSVLNISGCDLLPLDENEKETELSVKCVEVEKPKKASFLQQWTKQIGKRKTEEVDDDVTESKKNKNDEDVTSNESNKDLQNGTVQNLQVEVKKKRITPVLISKTVSKKSLSPPKLSPQVPIKIMTTSTEATEVKAKRRIQPIQIYEVNKTKSNTVNNTEKMIEMPILTPEVMETDNSTDLVKSDVIELLVSDQTDDKQKKAEPLKIDELKMPAPITPKNIEKHKNTCTPVSNTKNTSVQKQTTPQQEKTTSEKTSSSKKKKQNVPPSNTLFNYLKPVTKTPTSDTTTLITHETQKTEFKPVELFGSNDSDDTKLPNGKKEVKVKVSNLFKGKSKADDKPKEVKVEPTLSEETTTEIPDDFILRVDEVNAIDDSSDAVEKENGLQKTNRLEGNELKEENISCGSNLVNKLHLDIPETKRRIPLITLSSPKNKKKPKIAETE